MDPSQTSVDGRYEGGFGQCAPTGGGGDVNKANFSPIRLRAMSDSEDRGERSLSTTIPAAILTPSAQENDHRVPSVSRQGLAANIKI